MFLPGFPLHLWSKEVFKDIASRVGQFVFFDKQILGQEDLRMEKVLTKNDLSQGLVLELDNYWNSIHFVQPLD